MSSTTAKPTLDRLAAAVRAAERQYNAATNAAIEAPEAAARALKKWEAACEKLADELRESYGILHGDLDF